MKTFVIAEAGSNHNGSLDIAKKMIDCAVEAMADAVKFQIFKSEEMYSKNTPDFAGYKDIPSLIKSLEFDRSWLVELKTYCDNANIEFMATPFDEEAVDLLVGVGVKHLKIAGFEASDPRFVRMATSRGLPTIISLGSGLCPKDMGDLLLNTWDVPSKNLTFLHCNNAYPTPDKDIKLSTITKLLEYRDAFFLKCQIGLSDHTTGIYAPAFAVTLGATVIEKHFTLDRRMTGPDHSFAIEPADLKEMVSLIRMAETMKGEPKDGLTESEEFISKARRSVVVSRDVVAREELDEHNVTTKRPFLDNAVPAKTYYGVLGAKFARSMRKDDIVMFGDLA